VSYIVDGVPWKDVDDNSGGIEDFVRPQELQAVELYSPSTTPAEFMNAGQSGCSVLVLWTNRRIHGTTKKPARPPI
jgi:hypothetical protein